MKNPDETAHKETSHLELHCLQMCVRVYLMSEFTRLYPRVFKTCTRVSALVIGYELNSKKMQCFNLWTPFYVRNNTFMACIQQQAQPLLEPPLLDIL